SWTSLLSTRGLDAVRGLVDVARPDPGGSALTLWLVHLDRPAPFDDDLRELAATLSPKFLVLYSRDLRAQLLRTVGAPFSRFDFVRFRWRQQGTYQRLKDHPALVGATWVAHEDLVTSPDLMLLQRVYPFLGVRAVPPEVGAEAQDVGLTGAALL